MFYSEECWQKQIDTDEAVEKGSKKSATTTREQQMQQQKNAHREPV
jgi:hypothetical protein